MSQTVADPGCWRKYLAALALGSFLALPAAAAPKTHTPADGTALSNLLNNKTDSAGPLELGDTITLQAGSTYAGTFTLPNVTTGTGYIAMQSSAIASLPAAGVRVFPANASNMPTLRATGSNSRTILTAAGANHYKLIGLQIVGTSFNDANELTAIVDLGNDTQTLMSDVPNNIVIDRCIVRANSTTQPVRHGITLNSASTDITNSYIYDIKDASTDANAILGYNGPGPFNIVNNYVEASAEEILFGGSTPSLPNVVPSDIYVAHNHLTKNANWIGSSYLIKNHFELKAGQRVTVDGNLMNLSWHGNGGQSGKAISFKCVRENDANAHQGQTWTVTQDITVTNNIVYDCGIGVSLGGSVDTNGGNLYGWPKNLTVRNNLIYNVNSGTITGPNGSATWGSGNFINFGDGAISITFDHNTGFAPNNLIAVDGPLAPSFVYTNNLTNRGTYGLKGPSQGSGTATWNAWFGTASPAGTWSKNVLAIPGTSSPTSGYLPALAGGWDLSPFNNGNLGYPNDFSTVMVNQANPGTNYAGYKVLGWDQPTNTTSYPYNNTGTDGKDIGCDIDAVNTATAGCISGSWSNPVSIVLKNGVNGYSGATSFMANGATPTTWQGPAQYHNSSNRQSPTSQYILRSFYKFDVSSIPAGAVIDSATLKIKTENVPGSNVYLNAYRVAPVGNAFTVNYAAATQTSYNGTSATWTGGANAAGNVSDSNNDFLDTPDDSQLTGAAGWYNLNVKSSVQAWVSGTANNGWILTPDPTTPNVVIYLSTPADLNGSGDYPELDVTYH